MNRLQLPPEFRTPESDAYAAKLSELESLHGLEYVHHWKAIRQLLNFDGRVKAPPSGASFVDAMLAGGNIPLDDHQKADYRQFWAWYLPMERSLLELAHALRFFERADPDLCERLSGVALHLCSLYREKMRSGELKWIPRRPPNDVTVIDSLSQCVARLNAIPPQDDTPMPTVEEWI